MRKLLLALWPVFNATISKKAFYDLVVPVYQSDEESCSDKKHLLVTGAFLGWLFVRIQLKTVNRILDIQKNTSAGNKLASIAANGGRVREALTEELKAIRLALNPFAEMYLLGEMEWLLEQEWGNAQDAAHFTTTHFHHCDGWIGDPSFTPPKRALLEDYFTFCRQHTKQGNDSVLEEIVEDTTSSSEITHLVVNVGRSFEFDGSPETPPIPIVLRKRPDTALPDDRGERRDYATQVAKSVRQVFDVARMRHAEHKAAISEGRNKASHSLPYTISLCLGKLRDYADAAKALENVSFPINSRDDIPRAIREFSYPIELYAYGVEYALLQERDSDAFNRLIPQVEWIDDTVREHGLTSALVGELAEKISWPLARFSLMRSGQFRSPASIPEYHIEGNIPPADLRLKDNVSARVLVAAITECIREAFHHCSGDSPEIRIMLISGSPSKVVIKNSCMSLQDPTAFKAGNQSAMLNHLQTHLGGWRIEHPPACDGGYWIRTITQVPL